jgi:predicted amidophosphoribosyltransferase
VGTAPWELLLDAKFERLAPDAVAQRVTLVAAALWATVDEVAPQFFEGAENITVPIPSSRDLIRRCAAEASARDWPTLAFDDCLAAAPRPRQSELSAAERQDAARGKYVVEGDLRGRAALLLDDVYTSGFTMHDAARALREAGAASVTGVVYARRVFPDAMALYREARDV